MIEAIAIDDEPLALGIIERFCSKIEYIQLIRTFTRTDEALAFLRARPVQLVFLDIQMPKKNGLELAQELPPDTRIIFTTAFAEYAVEGFNLEAADYLLKPFGFERFLKAVAREKTYREWQLAGNKKEKKIFQIRADYRTYQVDADEILYVEGSDDYLKIVFEHQKPLVARMTLKTLMEKLPEDEFIRVHRSFIIPFKRISFYKNSVVSVAGKEIPIGGVYLEPFEKKMNELKP